VLHKSIRTASLFEEIGPAGFRTHDLSLKSFKALAFVRFVFKEAGQEMFRPKPGLPDGKQKYQFG
jgi:hypothetical protein